MTSLTKEEAKSISKEVWWYLKEYPEIDQMKSLPESTFRKIKTFWRMCALCDYMIDNDLTCSDFCPLQHCGEESMFVNWWDAKTDDARRKYATQIYDAINNWDVTE